MLTLTTKGFIALTLGVLVGIGGVMGFLIAHSIPSLLIGVGSGVLLTCSGLFLARNNTFALILSQILIALLALFFGYRFFLTGKIFPAGFFSLLSFFAFIALVLPNKHQQKN